MDNLETEPSGLSELIQDIELESGLNVQIEASNDLLQQPMEDVLGLVSLEDGKLGSNNGKNVIGHSSNSSLKGYFEYKTTSSDNSGASFFDNIPKDDNIKDTEEVTESAEKESAANITPKPLENGILIEKQFNVDCSTNKPTNGNTINEGKMFNPTEDTDSNNSSRVDADTPPLSFKEIPEFNDGLGDLELENNEIVQSLPSHSEGGHEEKLSGRLTDPEPKDSGSSVAQTSETSPQVCKFFSSVEDDGLTMATNHFGDLGLPPSNLEKLLENVTWSNEDPFESSIRKSEADQRMDSWIPNERTRQTLITIAKTTPGTFFPDKDQLTMPGVVLVTEQGDPIRDFVLERLGADVAAERSALTADDVPQDESGLKKLVGNKCYRAAVNLTNRWLKNAGQGFGKFGHPSNHTPNSLQVWFLRISLLMKLGLFAAALAESEAFGCADKPDLFYEFYPDTYGKRKGSMFPFAFRVLLGEVFLYNNKFKEALDHLCSILSVIRQILKNLEDNLREDGTRGELSDSYRNASIELWKSREIKVMYAVLNSTVVQQDYHSAVRLLSSLRQKDEENCGCIWSAQGRIMLQLGDIKAAQSCFAEAAVIRENSEKLTDRVSALVDRSVMCICQNNFADAYAFLQQARELDPKNAMVLNNTAVCLLYMCKMRAALKLLEDALNSDTETFLQECVVFNICTLYELESSNSVNKKLKILEIVNKFRGDGFNISYLKIPPKEDKK